MSLAASFPLTIYFDASCPLCRKEMSALRDHDAQQRLALVDCSGPDFDDREVRRAGYSVPELMRLIHARDADGRWFIGVDVFVLAYDAVGIRSMAEFWAHPRLRPVWDWLYPWVARHRMVLSRLGFTAAFDAFVRWLGRRALARSRACRDDRCELP